MPLLTPPIKNIKITDTKPSANELARFAEVRRKSTISQVTEPLKEQILKGTRRSRLFRRSQECTYHR